MDFAKTRCPFCYKYFCCSVHRADHELKNHSDKLHKENLILKTFQRKAEDIYLKSQKRTQSAHTFPKHKDNLPLPTSVKNHATFIGPTTKRLHHEMDKRILSTSVTLMSQSRQILIPVHRLQSQIYEDSSSTGTVEMKKNFIRNTAVVQTSTPIYGEFPIKNSQKITWFTSPPSSITSIYQTPSNECDSNFVEPSATKTPSRKLSVITTPLRSIMSKVSKYEYSNDSVPSPSVSITRSRRVTFSISSHVSSTSNSPLESVPEVEICHEVRDENNYVVESNEALKNCVATEQLTKNFEHYNSSFEDSPSIKNTGFFSCMTSAFYSAIHTIPSLASWRVNENRGDRIGKRPRSRSPDPEYRGLRSPQYKRPCYTFDLRQNPIKSRRAISDPSLSLLKYE